MADKSLLELPLATTSAGALLYGVQDNMDKAFSPSVLVGAVASQPANTFYAGPSAPPGNVPSFRPIVANDIPDLSAFYMKAAGGNLIGASLSNCSMLGGSISGASAVFDEDKFTIRDATDTTRTGKFNVDIGTAGTSVTWTLPGANAVLVGRDTTDTLTNKKLFVTASTATGASLRVPHGVPPSSPVNGDLWTTQAGLFAHVNDTTVGPFAEAISSTVTSFNTRIGAVTLVQSDVTTALGYVPYNPAQGSYLPIAGGTLTGNIVVTGSLAARDVTYIGGGPTGTGDKIRVVNTGSGTSVRIDSVNSTASSFTPMNFCASSYQFTNVSGNTICEINGSGQVTVSKLDANSVDSNTMSLVEQGGGAVLQFNHTSGVGRYFINHDDSSWRINTMDDSGSYTGTAITVARSNLDVSFGGRVTASGGFGPGSDPRLKDESSLKIVDNAVDILYNLNVRKGKYHDWYNPDGKERFFIMADKAMEQAAPEAILEGAIEKDGKAYNGWSADQMIALLVQSVKELKEEIAALKEKNNELSH